MFNAELDMCKHLYDDHVIQVSGVKTEKLQHGMAIH